MDSLTQIVLGAACGEVALGKKIGNKAMLFGAIGGTVPDLDVIIGNLFYSNEIDQLAFHRGFMHSIVFALIASLVLGFVFYELYNSGRRKDTTNLKDWIWLFFLSIFTHPLLDSFTPYGTQLFLPFTDYRLAFNNISVADPFYTLPFLITLIIALFFKRKNPKRFKWVKAGIYISSAYLIFTLGNKIYVDSVFKKTYKEANITYQRFSAQPTILNNFLWYSVAETEENYYAAFYSIFDKNNVADKIIIIPKNHHLLNMEHADLKVLRWFSKEYYSLQKIDTTKQIIYKDLRYPLMIEDDANSSLFSFELVQENERWNTQRFQRDLQIESIWDFFGGIYGRAFRDF
ncbi:metal-dependent hydrolase [Pseudotenacibaculum sp. MALMAid0570]|uniref:metal-dependent hydrolase n=1 Tax=Pseudotenacibaculum sp. MALMAid0570 TaxID=3143938 RepID=UPI0032E03575